MGGFFGAVATRDVTLDIFFGVDYHSHLSARRGGMVVYDEVKGFTRQIHNIESSPFWSVLISVCTPFPPLASSTIPRS